MSIANLVDRIAMEVQDTPALEVDEMAVRAAC
jgi:hypothetical protein